MKNTLLHTPTPIPAFKSDGFVKYTYSKSDNDITFSIISDMNTCNVVGNGTTLYTPNDKIPYQIISEIETSPERFCITVLVGSKQKKFQCTILNMDAKTMSAVRSIK